MTEWEIEERMPRFDDVSAFDVWLRNGAVRRVRRVGNRSTHFTPGTLVFLDCIHPLQNAICDEENVIGWRHSGMLAPVDESRTWKPFANEFVAMLGLKDWLPVTSP